MPDNSKTTPSQAAQPPQSGVTTQAQRDAARQAKPAPAAQSPGAAAQQAAQQANQRQQQNRGRDLAPGL